MRREPLTKKTPEILASFAHPLNYRPPLDTIPHERIAAAHGTNFATVVQALAMQTDSLCPIPDCQNWASSSVLAKLRCPTVRPSKAPPSCR